MGSSVDNVSVRRDGVHYRFFGGDTGSKVNLVFCYWPVCNVSDDSRREHSRVCLCDGNVVT